MTKFRLDGKVFDTQRFPYIRVRTSVAVAVNPKDLTMKTFNGIDWASTTYEEGRVDIRDHVSYNTKDGYNREITTAYASPLPSTGGGVTDLDSGEAIAPNWDSCGGFGAYCLLPPA